MSSAKRGGGLQYYLESPLFGNQVSRNPGAARERAIQSMLERNIAELAMNRFAYENVPDSVDTRFIELQMLYNGMVVWYWDDDFGQLLAVRGNGTGNVNFYDNPISFTTIGPGNTISVPGTAGTATLYQPKTLKAYIPTSDKNLPEKKKKRLAVGMYPNALRIPEYDIIQIYSTRIATIDRTLEINSKNARRNKVIKGPANQQLSLVNVSRQQDEGVEAIQVSGAMNVEEQIAALDLGVPPGALADLSLQRKTWWNECMNLLGIDNANQDKKERLVAAEVSANDGQTDAMRHVALNARRQAIEYVNDIWGTNIQVDYKVEIEAREDAEKNIKATQQAGGEDNEKPSEKLSGNKDKK